MAKNYQKQIKYADFLTQYVNNCKNFVFKYKNFTMEFCHDGDLYVVKLNDSVNPEKLIKISIPMFINRITINNVLLCDVWDYFTLVKTY